MFGKDQNDRMFKKMKTTIIFSVYRKKLFMAKRHLCNVLQLTTVGLIMFCL